jgi:hypothetical protein
LVAAGSRDVGDMHEVALDEPIAAPYFATG